MEELGYREKLAEPNSRVIDYTTSKSNIYFQPAQNQKLYSLQQIRRNGWII